MIGIYKITNVLNQKVYIGQSVNIEKRWKAHKVAFQNPADHCYEYPLYRAMRKYGLESFSFEVIEECQLEQLNEKEVYWIQYYNSLNEGYNQTTGGDSFHTKEQLDIANSIKKDLFENVLTYTEIQEKYDITIQTLGAINNGRTYYDDTIKYPIRNFFANTESYCQHCGKPITKNATYCSSCAPLFMRTVERPEKEVLVDLIVTLGFEEVGRRFGVSGNAIKKWCDAYGLPRIKKEIVQLYKNIHNIVEKTPEEKAEHTYSAQPVAQIQIETGEIIQIFPSASAAARYTGSKSNTSHITDVCKGKRNSAYGYKWCYYQE